MKSRLFFSFDSTEAQYIASLLPRFAIYCATSIPRTQRVKVRLFHTFADFPLFSMVCGLFLCFLTSISPSQISRLFLLFRAVFRALSLPFTGFANNNIASFRSCFLSGSEYVLCNDRRMAVLHLKHLTFSY